MTFAGTVRLRSTSADPRKRRGPAGEAEVFRCNPQRKRRIMEVTRWRDVFKGTLNLDVDDGVVAGLKNMKELFPERPEDIRHPTNPTIPERRGGYHYYEATASVRGKTQEVLVRRARNPHDERCVELVAPVKLMDHFGLRDGSQVEVTVRG